MASIERTAYSRFRRVVNARELADLTPTEDDVAWARQRSTDPLPSVQIGRHRRFYHAGVERWLARQRRQSGEL